MTESEFTIYKITCLPSGRIYIGLTKNKLSRRWNDHVSCANRQPTRNRLFYGSILKYGRDQFRIEVLYLACNRKEAEVVERAMIATYRTLAPMGMNMTLGGEGTCGFRRKHSAETRAKMSIAATGLQKSKETREKMSRAKKGKPIHPNLLMACRNRAVKPATESTRRKLSVLAKERWRQWRATHPKPIREKRQSGERGIYWDSARQKWTVEIQRLGKKIRGGRYTDLINAITKRDKLISQTTP